MKHSAPLLALLLLVLALLAGACEREVPAPSAPDAPGDSANVHVTVIFPDWGE